MGVFNGNDAHGDLKNVSLFFGKNACFCIAKKSVMTYSTQYDSLVRLSSQPGQLGVAEQCHHARLDLDLNLDLNLECTACCAWRPT